MKLFHRVRYILSANLNDLVDRCENPEQMLRQAVRDMETSFTQLLEAAAQAIAHERTLTRQRNDQWALVERHLQAAGAAVARGDHDAARRELRTKTDCERLAERLTQQQQTAASLSERLRRQVAALRVKLAEARQKLLEVTARARAAAARRKFVTRANGVDYLDTTANFDRWYARVDAAEAETDALLELLGEVDAPATDAQFDADIEAQLAALEENTNHVATT
jgi:phage shock protein A